MLILTVLLLNIVFCDLTRIKAIIIIMALISKV